MLNSLLSLCYLLCYPVCISIGDVLSKQPKTGCVTVFLPLQQLGVIASNGLSCLFHLLDPMNTLLFLACFLFHFELGETRFMSSSVSNFSSDWMGDS